MKAILLDALVAAAGRALGSLILRHKGILLRASSDVAPSGRYKFEVEISTWSMFFWILANPRLRLGEAYQDGTLSVKNGDISELLSALFEIEDIWNLSFLGRLHKSITRRRFLKTQEYGETESKKNIHLHYDLGNDFYETFLDREMNYSCGFFEGSAENVEDAQSVKIKRALERCTSPKSKEFLEIGCGWGALAETANSKYDLNVTGISLSREQIHYCKTQRSGDINFLLEDYRNHAKLNSEKYDSIASIGMFEHVGIGQFEEYFQSISRLLKKNGQAVVHTIIRPDSGITNPWIDQYVFPGGYIASEQELEAALAKTPSLELVATHKYHGQHYMKTLRSWRENLTKSKEAVTTRYDDSLHRTFEFYLAGSEAAFRSRGMFVAQFEIKKV